MSEPLRIPDVILPPTPPNPSPAYYVPTPPQQEFDYEKPPVPLSHYLWILRRQLWKIIAFVATCVLATAIVSARLRPIYESTATIDIDRQVPAGVVGQESSQSSAVGDSDQFLSTQIKIIQSDSVLRPVAEQFHLLDREGPTKNINEETKQESAAAPVVLARLKVTRPTNTYLILINYSSTDKRLAAAVANAVAHSYLAHTYDMRIRSSASVSNFMEGQLDELKAKMEKSGQALAKFESELDVVNPEEKTNILSARLIQLNTDYTAAQTDRVSKEAALNAIHSGSIEAAQVSSQGASLAKLQDALNEANQHFALVKSTYGSSHPEYGKAATSVKELQRQFDETRKSIADRIAVEYGQARDREGMLQKAVADTKAEWESTNSRNFQYQQLKREADADKSLYDELIRKIRESDINIGFQDNNIRIADLARPGLHPVFPDVQLNLLLAFMFSALLGIGVALLLDALDTTLRDPTEASRYLATDVIGTLPIDSSAKLPKQSVSPIISTLTPKSLRNGNRNGYYSSSSHFEEAIRTLRNTILLSDFEGRLRSIVLTSAAPGEGKTTLAAHLAIANADRGQKTLLVDGDMRRPSVHTKFGLSTREGLSNVLTGELAWQQVVCAIEDKPNLNIITAGPGSHRAADLIGPRLSTLLDEFAKDYDLVILDSPPLLGFAECLQMSTAADGVLIVSYAGETRRRAVAEVVTVLNRLHANIIGVVLNRASSNTSSDGYYYGYYRYGYEQKAKS
jgi:capsular exopolysaccharide synthesis family protein